MDDTLPRHSAASSLLDADHRRDEGDRPERTEDRLRWELAVNAALAEVSQAVIAGSNSIADIARIILDAAKRLTDSEHGFVSSIDPLTRDNVAHTLTAMMGESCRVSATSRRIAFSVGADGRYRGLWGHALNTREAHFTNAPRDHPAAAGLPAGHIPLHNFLSCPAVVGGELVGQIALSNASRDYSQHDLDAIKRLADLYALAVRQQRSEDALRESRESYRTLVENSDDIIIRFDRQGRHVYASPSIRNVVDIAPADLLGKTRRQLGFPDDQCDFWERRLESVFASGDAAEAEFTIEDERGRHVFNWRLFPELGTDGDVASVLSVAREVTGRKRAEEELCEQTRLAQTLLDAMPCVALLLRPSTREIVAANKAGLEAGCIIGQTCYGTWVKSESPCSFCLAPDVWKDGKAKHLEVEALGVVWDANWVPINDDLYLHYAFDITERRRAERATAQSEAKFRALFERTPDSVLLVDPETGAILEFNRRAHEVLGYTREEFEHLQVADFEAKESSNEVAAHTRRIGARGDDCFETQHRTKDGRVLDVLVNSGTVFVAGRKCIVSTLTDITEKHRLLADARQEARIRQNLLRELNHRVKNNLATIAGFLQLEKGRPEREKGAFIQALQGRLSSLSELHVLLGEHLAGEVDVEKLVQRVVNTTVWNLEGTAPTTTVTVRADGAHLDTDRAGAIAMLISELVSNAVRHGLRGLENPQLQVELTHDQDGWRLCVSDNGRGFEDGFDLAGNAGSGLQIVQFIVEKQLRGTLELTRDADRTTVTIHCSHLTSNPDAG